jgi:protein-tyrosine phosphatase
MNEKPNGNTFLEKQPNFRSLGGIRTISGKRIRRNLIYRSGSLNNLSVADISKLQDIGLAMIIDFRSDREVTLYPSDVIPTVKQTVRIVIADEARDRAMEFLDRNDAKGLEEVLVTDYRRMIRNDSGCFSEFFRVLEQAVDLPLVYHCAAGKDRTGIATVLLLSALGVDMNTIMEDYFLSNQLLEPFVGKLIKKLSGEGKNGEIIRPMMEVRPEYLRAALDEIDTLFGGMDNYLNNILKADTELLQAKYLE